MNAREKELIELQYNLETMSETELYDFAKENYPDMEITGKKKILIRRIMNTERDKDIKTV